MNTIEIIFTILAAITGGLFILTFVESLANMVILITNTISNKNRKTAIYPSVWIVPAIMFMLFVLFTLLALNF